MKNPLFSALYILSLLTAGLTIRQAFAERSPSVEPITEVSIEENRPVIKDGQVEKGYDFSEKIIAANNSVEVKRIPANITTKSTNHSTPGSFLGPMIFLLALPIALWIAVSKKLKNNEIAEKADNFFPKNYQFNTRKSVLEEQDHDDEEQNLPKAS
jgi:hypothetical protein